MERYFKCPKCGEVIDIVEATKNKNGKVVRPQKTTRYRTTCECGWSTGLSYNTVLHFYEECIQESTVDKKVYQKLGIPEFIDTIDETISDVDRIPKNMADFAENNVKILLGIKDYTQRNQTYTAKQEKAVINIKKAIQKVLHGT